MKSTSWSFASKFIVFLLFCFANSTLHAQNTNLFPIQKAPYWGMVNAKGRVVIPTKFDKLKNVFKGTYILVQKDDKFGLYNQKGEQVLSPIHEEIQVLDKDIIIFSKDKKWGLHSQGTTVFPANLEEITRLNSSFVRIKQDQKYGVADLSGELVIIPEMDTVYIADTQNPNGSNLFYCKQGGIDQLINSKGRIVAEPPLNNLEVLANSFLLFQSDKKWGIISPEAEQLVPADYLQYVPISEDFIALLAENRKWALFSCEQKKLITEAEYEFFEVLNKDLIKVRANRKAGLMNTKGQVTLPISYDNLHGISENLFSVKKDGNWGVIDKNNKKLLPLEYDFIYDFPNEISLTKIQKNKKEGLIDAQAKIILPAEYDYLEAYQDVIFAHKGENVTILHLDEQGKFKSKKTYNSFNDAGITSNKLKNRVYFNLGVIEKSVLSWRQRNTKKWILISPSRKKVIAKEYDKIYIDPFLKLTLAKIQNEDKVTTQIALIDHFKGKTLFNIAAADIDITDFREADIARVSLDTLEDWNAIITKEGKLIKDFEGAKIDTVGQVNEGMLWVKSGGKFGFVDNSGNLTISFAYESANDFQYGLAKVKKENQFGYINKKGESIVSPDYQELSPFKNGFSVSIKDKKYGLLDKEGKVMIPNEYQKMSFAKNGIVRAKKEGKWGVLSIDNQVIVPFEYVFIGEFENGIAKIRQNKLWGFVDEKGKVILAPSISADFVGTLKNGIAEVANTPFRDENSKSILYKKHGYIDASAKQIIATEYDEILGFEQIWKAKKGLARLRKDNKFGYLNHTGKVIVPTDYDEIKGDFEKVYLAKEGVIKVRKGALWGYIDHTGKEVIECKYNSIKNFEKIWHKKDLVTVVKKGSKYGTIDWHGLEIIKPKYDFIGMSPYNDTLAVVRQDKKWGVINQFDSTIIPIEYDKISYRYKDGKALLELQLKAAKYIYFNQEGRAIGATVSPKTGMLGEGLIPSFENKKWGFTDTLGVWKIDARYQAVGTFVNGLAPAKLAGKWGYINTQGEWGIQPTFENARAFHGNLAPAKLAGKWGLINKAGKWILSNEHSKIGEFNKNGTVSAAKSLKGQHLYALISMTGKALTKYQYSELGELSEGLLAAKFYSSKADKHKFGYLNEKGIMVIDYQFAEAQSFSEGMAKIRMIKGRKWSFINKKGAVLIKSRFQTVSDFGEGIALADGGILIDKKGTKIGALMSKKIQPLGKFSDGLLAVKNLEEGYYHVDKTGNPLYTVRYDSITNFQNGIAFVKSGEVWQLKRGHKDGITGEKNESTIRFSKAGKLKYLAKAKEKGKKKAITFTKYGGTIIDLDWKLIKNGSWRMIDTQGRILKSYTFSDFERQGDIFKIKVNKLYGIANTKGDILAKPTYENLKLLKGNAILLENTGKVSYLGLDGKWIWGEESK
jgi:hypothetical protein